LATLVTAASLSASTQILSGLADALWLAAGAIDAPTSATSAAAANISAPMRQENLLNMSTCPFLTFRPRRLIGHRGRDDHA
jgi:hypothetical protein